MDLGTGLALLGSAKLAEKVFGPTAEYIGQGLRSFTENRVRNVRSIFEKAVFKASALDEDRLKSPASPLIVSTVFDFGSYTEDSLVQDYLASLLISSRTTNASDDRAAVFGNLLKNLTVLQVRTHYLMYNVVRALYVGSGRRLGNQVEREKVQTYISVDLFNRHVFLQESQRQDSEYLFNSILHGLWRNNLIEQSFAHGSIGTISQYGPPIPVRPGIVFQPSAFGIELFLWINLITERTTPFDIVDPQKKIEPIFEFDIVGNAFQMPSNG